MPIKSEIVVPEEKEKETPVFPCLMYNDYVIVLFRDEEMGTIVYRFRGDAIDIGSVLKNDLSNFALFKGTLRLSNEEND